MKYTKEELKEMTEGEMREVGWELGCELVPLVGEQIEIILKEQKKVTSKE